MRQISISIVSHLQVGLVSDLLADIALYGKEEVLEVILTLNLPEELPFSDHDYPFPLKVIRNSMPLGFGENHNQAFQHANGDYFCVLNPDIRIQENIFRPLVEALTLDKHIGLVAPQVINPDGEIEDSARIFPTVSEIFWKVLGHGSRRSPLGKERMLFPDWVAGMFMLFPSGVFREMGGFDKRYFLYYEDVDLCARLRLRDYRVALCRDVLVVHHARRTSHRNLKYLRWHAASMLRFFMSGAYREIRRASKNKKAGV